MSEEFDWNLSPEMKDVNKKIGDKWHYIGRITPLQQYIIIGDADTFDIHGKTILFQNNTPGQDILDLLDLQQDHNDISITEKQEKMLLSNKFYFEDRYPNMKLSSYGDTLGTRIFNANKKVPEWVGDIQSSQTPEDYFQAIYVFDTHKLTPSLRKGDSDERSMSE